MTTTETDAPPLFRGLKFYLTRTLSRDVARELQDLIEYHGGVVSSSPVGATQLVDHDKLDSRRREWVSTDYIRDSVDSGALQDPAKYSGILFDTRPRQQLLGGRVAYSVEDNARMLHFAKTRDWKSMESVPASAWKLAESRGLTVHSWQSMHEHFKKELQRKTPKEQRDIMAKVSGIIRRRLMRQEAEQERAQNEARTPPSTRRRDAEASAPITPASATFATTREAPHTPATSSPPRQIGQRVRQKRKRASKDAVVPESNATSGENEERSIRRELEERTNENEEEKSTSREVEKKVNESDDEETHEVNAVYFRSVWTELARDPSKRARLQSLFRSSMVESSHPTRTESVASVSRVSESPIDAPVQEGSTSDEQQQVEVPNATDPETDAILCQLQLETNQETPCVVHALYYCSGDTDMARAFLKGASPSGMWSPEDDLLLVNLVVDENIDRSAVDAAVARGDFASIQVPRDTDAILNRVKFLR